MALCEFIRLLEQDEQFFQVCGSAKKRGTKKGIGTYYFFFFNSVLGQHSSDKATNKHNRSP